MSTPAAFDGAPDRGTINFSVGQPSADLLPLKLLGSGCERFFGDAAPFDLNYGQRQGDARFRSALAAFLGASAGGPVDPDSLMLTGGISQALDFVCGRFAQRGRRRVRGGTELSVFLPDLPRPRPRGRRHPDGRHGHGHRPPRAAARGAPPEARLHDPGVPQPDRPGDGSRAARPARRAVARARLHHRGRRGLPAPLPRRSAAAVVRHARRRGQRARARHVLEDPRPGPAPRLDPGDA